MSKVATLITFGLPDTNNAASVKAQNARPSFQLCVCKCANTYERTPFTNTNMHTTHVSPRSTYPLQPQPPPIWVFRGFESCHAAPTCSLMSILMLMPDISVGSAMAKFGRHLNEQKQKAAVFVTKKRFFWLEFFRAKFSKFCRSTLQQRLSEPRQQQYHRHVQNMCVACAMMMPCQKLVTVKI